MVSITATSKKYHGRMAAIYETKRKKQIRWDEENRIVADMLAGSLSSDKILDVPVGTGRFLDLYDKLGIKTVVGIDASSTMISLAEKKIKRLKSSRSVDLSVGDATKIEEKDKHFTTTVCVRFLDLIDEPAMFSVVRELTRVTKKQIILTIRLGVKYVPKSNTATHDEKKFKALVVKCGWKIERADPIFKAGWHVMRLVRK